MRRIFAYKGQSSNAHARATTADIRGTHWVLTIFDGVNEGGMERANIFALKYIHALPTCVNRINEPVPFIEFTAQDEVAPTTGKHHIQMCLQVATQVSLGRVKSAFEAFFKGCKVFVKKAPYVTQPKKWFAYALKNETHEARATDTNLGRIEGFRIHGFRDETTDEWKVKFLDQDEVDAWHAEVQEADAAAAPTREASRKQTLMAQLASGEMSLGQLKAQEPVQYGLHYRNFIEMRNVYLEQVALTPEQRKKTVMVLWGRPGTGKTSAVRYFLDSHGLSTADAYFAKVVTSGHGQYAQGKLWFDGYDGQRIIVFDDFEAKCSVEDFVHLTDFEADSFRFEVKGAKTRLLHSIVLITSNSDPLSWWYNESAEKRGAVQRRITFRQQFREQRETGNVARQMTDHAWKNNSAGAAYAGLRPSIALPTAAILPQCIEIDASDDEQVPSLEVVPTPEIKREIKEEETTGESPVVRLGSPPLPSTFTPALTDRREAAAVLPQNARKRVMGRWETNPFPIPSLEELGRMYQAAMRESNEEVEDEDATVDREDEDATDDREDEDFDDDEVASWDAGPIGSEALRRAFAKRHEEFRASLKNRKK